MRFTRYGRVEENKQRKKLVLAIVGSIALIVFLFLFGFKLLIGFSLLVEKLHGSTPSTQNPTQTIIQPPTLNALPVATKSGTLVVSGSGQSGLTAIVYVNDQETMNISVTKSGMFASPLTLKDGVNTISAKLMDNKGNLSDLSNVVTVEIKQKQPTLNISSPGDNASILGENNIVTISGNTDDNTTVTVNGRFIVIKSDNTFSYQYPLSDGQNKLTIIATDDAGNSTTVERSVTYQK
jgi:hypothetical protein